MGPVPIPAVPMGSPAPPPVAMPAPFPVPSPQAQAAIDAAPLPSPAPAVAPAPTAPVPPADAGAPALAEGAAEASLEQQKGQEAAERLAERVRQDEERRQTQQKYDEARQAAQSHLDDLEEQHKDFKFHDYFSTRSMADKALIFIGGILGGRMSDDVLDKAVARDYDRQVAQLNSIETEQKWAREGIKDTETQREHALAELNYMSGRKFDAIADKFITLGATARSNAAKAKAEQKANDYRALAAKADQAAKEQAAKIALQEAETKKYAAQAAAGGFAPRKGAKGAGGGGPGRSDAYAAFVDAVNKLPAGAQIPTDIAKLGVKAGLKVNQVPDAVKKIRDEASRSTKTGNDQMLKIQSALDTELKGDKELAKFKSEGQELSETLAALKSGNPIRYGTALDKYTKSATGLGARPSSVKVFEQRLGGTWEQIKAKINAAISGNHFSDAELARFIDAVQSTMKENKADLATTRARHESAAKENPIYKSQPELTKAVFDRAFGGLTEEKAAKLRAVQPGDKRYAAAQEVLKANGY